MGEYTDLPHLTGPERDRKDLSEIWDDLGTRPLVVQLFSDEERHMLTEALSRLPDDIYERVIEELDFMPPMQENERGVCVVFNTTTIKALVRFNDTATKSLELFVYVILHEIAHYVLGHGGGQPMADTDRIEREADDLAAKWGAVIPPEREGELVEAEKILTEQLAASRSCSQTRPTRDLEVVDD